MRVRNFALGVGRAAAILALWLIAYALWLIAYAPRLTAFVPVS